MMSFRKLAATILSEIRYNVAVIDDPVASEAQKGAALIELLSGDARFCCAIGKLAFRPARAASFKPVQPVDSVPAPAPTGQMPGKPIEESTGPARTLNPPRETPEAQRNKLISNLSGFIAGKWIDYEKTRDFVGSVFQSMVEITEEQWGIIFSAMKRVAEKGHYLVDVRTAPKLFGRAPTNLLDDYIFGLGGALLTAFAEVGDVRNNMPSWLVAKTHILVNAIDALDRNLEGGLGEQEMSQICKLRVAIERVDGPTSLTSKIGVIVRRHETAPATETIGNSARIIGDLSSVVVKPINGKQADPAETARLVAHVDSATSTASAFAAAVSPN